MADSIATIGWNDRSASGSRTPIAFILNGSNARWAIPSSPRRRVISADDSGGFGWRVNALEPERVIGLENWGTFVLVPVDSSTTRLIVRTRGAGASIALGFVFAPIDVFVFEPAHFIMERAMLRGIRDRAERSWQSAFHDVAQFDGDAP